MSGGMGLGVWNPVPWDGVARVGLEGNAPVVLAMWFTSGFEWIWVDPAHRYRRQKVGKSEMGGSGNEAHA